MMRLHLLAASALAGVFAAACEAPTSARLGPPGGPPERQSRELVVHEWGTFTSVQGSDGKTVDGLQHTEELLPAFVHARDLTSPERKGMEIIPEPVTQKLETPVLYFYGPAGKVQVEVDFPGGIVSEWFPAAKTFEPAVAQATRMGGGKMSWEAELIPAADLKMPEIEAGSVWAPSRQVGAAGVRIGGEDERFVFYRGLGRFEMDVRVTAAEDGSIQIGNGTPDEIPAVFVLRAGAGGGGVSSLGALAGNASRRVDVLPEMVAAERYVADVQATLRSALEASGLFGDESQAMVETWTRSWFLTPGIRILYVLPRPWTDALLPIRIDPAPSSLVRTLVGRVEVMTPAEEQSILRDLQDGHARGVKLSPEVYGRFSEPKIRRAAALITDPALAKYVADLLVEVAAAP